jgi:hypothetical protein
VHCRHKSGTSQAQKTSIQITAARVHTNSQHRTCSVTSLLHVGSYTLRSSLSMQSPRRGQHNISTTSFSTRSTTTTSINATTASVRRMNQHRHQYDAIRNVPQTNNRRSRKESVRKRTPTRAGQCHHIPQHTARSRHHVTNGDSRMSTLHSSCQLNANRQQRVSETASVTQGSTFVHRDVFTSNTAASPIPNSQLLFSPRAGTIACPLTGAMIITCADGSCLGSWKHEVEVVFHHSRTSQDTNLSCITHTSSQPTAGIRAIYPPIPFV